ncbi:MAG: C26 family cysteine hydrolase domain-containing family [Bdellovibrionales bacterium]|nr:C26 family cysteine hydrolase domain-containing family [Bdellovibrionales bacterium]
MQPKFLIIDGYSKESRDKFDNVGMTTAGELYGLMLKEYLPNSLYEIFYSSDDDSSSTPDLSNFNGILWPGCNLTIYDEQDLRVTKMINIANLGFEKGIPQFGSCWGAQIAVYIAGGKVKSNPKGREMGIARNITLYEDGINHPMYKNKPKVFEAFISHVDEITSMPENSKILSGNKFTSVQAVDVKYKNGSFWAVQYHPEYNFIEMSKLIQAREEKLILEKFFENSSDLLSYSSKMELLEKFPEKKDLKWQLGIDDSLLDKGLRQIEFQNWINYFYSQS